MDAVGVPARAVQVAVKAAAVGVLGLSGTQHRPDVPCEHESQPAQGSLAGCALRLQRYEVLPAYMPEDPAIRC